MGIKKVIKISFILILFIIAVIGIINTIVIYQIKENNSTKQSINNLVFMQERMNELLKDTLTMDSIDKLDKAKEDFINYELNFEKIRERFEEDNQNDLVDFFISDINADEIIATNLNLLFQSEKEIEEAFDLIDTLQENKIELSEQFSKDYPVEAIEWAMATRTHWEDWHFPRVEKKATIITKSGGFRKRVTTHKGIKAGFVEFNAVGDADKIEYLLNSLGFIGLNNSQGFGEIQDIQISEIENDYSFFDENNELARNLPVSMVEDKGYLSVKNSVTPPYQNSERIDSFIPKISLIALIRS